MGLRMGLCNEDTFDYDKNGYSLFTLNQNVEIVRRLWWALYMCDAIERRHGDPFYLIQEADCQTCLPTTDSIFSLSTNHEMLQHWINPGSPEAKKQIAYLSSTTVFYPSISSVSISGYVIQLHKIERRIMDFARKAADLNNVIPEHELELTMHHIEASLDYFESHLDPSIVNLMKPEVVRLGKELTTTTNIWSGLYVHLLCRYLKFCMYRGRHNGYEKQGINPITLQHSALIINFQTSCIRLSEVVAKMSSQNPMFLFTSPFVASILFEVGLMHVVCCKMCDKPFLVKISEDAIQSHVQALQNISFYVKDAPSYRDIIESMASMQLDKSLPLTDQYVILSTRISLAVQGTFKTR